MARRLRLPRPRILVLVPHEPDLDPRVGWVTDLCAAAADTFVLGTTWSTERPMRAYRGEAFIERISIPEVASARARTLGRVGGKVQRLPVVARYVRRRSDPGAEHAGSIGRLPLSLTRFATSWLQLWMIVDALHRRARAESVMPDLIVCHDLLALIVGARLKRAWGTPLLYDAHEFWPSADLLQEPWEGSVLARVERRLIRECDEVVTVSPPLAAQLERLYGLEGVRVVPNAVPLRREPPAPGPADRRVRFLLQGQLTPRRGIEYLLDAWSQVDARALLQLRYIPNAFTQGLESRYAPLLASGRVEVLPPVAEEELVNAAARADVGIVPYVGPNLNHVYACPNKVSQYMHAGLALLASRDLLYVGDLVERFGCGLTYDPRDQPSLREAVDSIVGNPAELARMKRASAVAAESDFNWEVVSRPYADAVRRLLPSHETLLEVA